MNSPRIAVKHISADNQPEIVKQFLLSLDIEPGGSIIECDGAFFRIFPTTEAGPASPNSEMLFEENVKAIQASINDLSSGEKGRDASVVAEELRKELNLPVAE